MGQFSSHSELDVTEAEWDIREHIRALPTKADIQQLIAAVELYCKQAVEGLREDTVALGHRVEAVETSHDDIMQVVTAIQDTTKHHEEVLNPLLDQIDNHENRDWRQNIHINGLPEATHALYLLPTGQGFFRQILRDSAPDTTEVDNVHQALLPVPQDTGRPRDVICKLHRYSVKEAIMKATRGKSFIDFDGLQLSLFPDLSRRTLM